MTLTTSILKWIIIISATINYGFMLFDGTRALIKGDYLRPQSGEYAGQLGPWSNVIRSVGIDPESTLMKMLFISWGLAGLFITFNFAMNMGWARNGLIVVSISSLWYLIPGTALSVLQIILLLIITII